MIGSKCISELTDRESEVLGLIAQGWSNRQIAEQLHIEIRTVKYHTANIYAKLDVKSRSAAIAWSWRHHIIRINSE